MRYMADIVATNPEVPFFIGGNCQGAIIALAIAQHALRRKLHVPLLILMDWAFTLQPSVGSVLLIAGRNNANHNAKRLFSRPELAWQRAFASCEFVEIPGGYADGLKPPAIGDLASVLTSRLHSALSKPLPMLPLSGYQAAISAADLTEKMQAGVRTAVKVVVTNMSGLAWGPTRLSGITLGCRWINPAGDVLCIGSSAAELPAIASHASVTADVEVMPPDEVGLYTLIIDLCEEGHRWFREPSEGFRASVRIVDARIRLPLYKSFRRVLHGSVIRLLK